MTITPPRLDRPLPTVGVFESMTQCSSGTPLPVKEWTELADVATLPPTCTKTGRPVGAAYPEHAWRGSGNSPPLYVVKGSVVPLPGKNTGYVPPVNELPRSVSRVPPSCHPDFTSRYEPKPVCVSRGSIMPMAWKGAAIHQSMICWSEVLVVELTWMLPFRAAASPSVV